MPNQDDAFRYIRAKVDQLLSVMGTLPLRQEELDDATLIELDPIGIVADSFAQVIDHLNRTNQALNLATAEIRTVFDSLGAAVVVLDRGERIVDCNNQALTWLFDGAERERIVGRFPNEVCSEAGALDSIRRQADGRSHAVTLYGQAVQVVASRILDESGFPIRTVMLFTDVTRQRENELHLQLYAEIFRHVGEGILITDADSRIVDVNAAVSRITGYSRDELIGATPAILKSGLHEASYYREMWRVLRQTGFWQGEVLDRTRDGRIVPLLQTISEVRGADGLTSHYISVITDISTIKETQSRLDFLAHHDALTGLPNRLLFGDRLRHAIERARREGHTVALLFIDLDRFKNVNDSLGHQVGDLLLVEAASRLRGLVRQADTVARLGGDEFVILLEDGATHDAAAKLAEKAVEACKQPFVVSSMNLHIGCSIGITVYPEDGADDVALLRNADTAMYRAKDAGRDCHVRYSAELSRATRARIALDSALRAAVRGEHFELHFQPIVDIWRGRVVACEALLRWPSGPEGARQPGDFIPLAEETRLIVPLGDWVLREALARLGAWRAEGLALDYVSVNISAVQLAHPDFPARVVALLEESGLPGRSLQIELTENVLMHDIALCAQVLARLRDHGVRVAIDDFGTGYSSLGYLKQLPIDNLKIDRSFVRDIPGDINDCAIAAAVIGLARTLGLEAVAEGIETQAQQDYLAQIGCSLVQGYLHARPISAAAFATEVVALHAALAEHAPEAHPSREVRPF
jgi:diguanylate cyclase (GGDEF)-like protein/PAS domain S-box-containing protein